MLGKPPEESLDYLDPGIREWGCLPSEQLPSASSLAPPVLRQLPRQLTVHDGLDLILGPQDQGAPGEGGAGEEEVLQAWVLQSLEQGPRGAGLPFPEGPLLGQGQVQNEQLGLGVQHAAGAVDPVVYFHVLKREGLVLRHHPALCDDSVGRHEANGQLLGVMARSREQLFQASVALGAGEGAEVACGAQQRVSRRDRPALGPGPRMPGPRLPQRTQSESPEHKHRASGHPGCRAEGQEAATDHV